MRWVHLGNYNVQKSRGLYPKEGRATYVELPKEVIALIEEGNVFETETGKRRYFLPFVFEKDSDDIHGNIFRVRFFDELSADDLGCTHMEIRKLTDEEFNKKYNIKAQVVDIDADFHG